MISVNKQAAKIVEEMVAHAESLGIQVSKLPGGAQVLDLGVQTLGGLQAGKSMAEVCLGGLGQVTFLPLQFGDYWLPGVGVSVDDPAIGCMAAQYAGWAIKRDKFFAMGSGPAQIG